LRTKKNNAHGRDGGEKTEKRIAEKGDKQHRNAGEERIPGGSYAPIALEDNEIYRSRAVGAIAIKGETGDCVGAVIVARTRDAKVARSWSAEGAKASSRAAAMFFFCFLERISRHSSPPLGGLDGGDAHEGSTPMTSQKAKKRHRNRLNCIKVVSENRSRRSAEEHQ
jgi:hypothetical protein